MEQGLFVPETEDLYEILNLHPSAHPDVIEAAYQRLALLYHPDTDPSPEAAGLMASISRAYAVLGDPEKRAAYDQNRKAVENTPVAWAEGESAESDSPEARPLCQYASPGLLYLDQKESASLQRFSMPTGARIWDSH